MDFNLDGDFGKISSFDMDMSDLDISPPLQKDAQSKEKSKETSSGTGKDKEKTDRFAFAFDFDELEDFSFESSLTKEGSKAQSGKNNKESSQNETGCQDKEDPMRVNLIRSTSTLDNGSRKPSLPGTLNTFDMDCLLGGSVDVEPSRKSSPSKLGMDDTAKHSVAIDEVASDKSKSRQERIASRELPKFSPSEKLVSPELIDREAFTGNDARQDLPSDSHPNNEPSGGNSSEAQHEVDFVNMIATGSNGEKDDNVASTTGSTCKYKHRTSGNSHHPKTVAMSEKKNGEESQVGVDDHVIDKIERTEVGQVNPLVETSCTTNAVSGMPRDTPSGRENLKPTSDILKFPSVSQPADHSGKETEKGSEPPLTCSKYFIQPEKPECGVQKASMPTTSSALSSKKMGFTLPTLVEGRRVANSADGLQNGKKLNDASTTQNNDMVKEKSALRQRETSMKDLDTLSMGINKQAAQNRGNPTTLASIPTMKSTPAEERKFSSIEGDKKAPALHGLKLSGLNLDSAKPPIQKDINSAGKVCQNRVSLRKEPHSLAPDMQKQTPSTLSIKRKTFEEDAADVIALHPSKRLSRSPTASRNSAETTENVLGEKVPNYNKREDDHVKSAIDNSHVSTFHIPNEVKVKSLEISVLIENDGNIKRAEAYNKELDHLCSMLRKKQDEAKELLVQAVVNSNKLLMLNSPHLEEKIRATQKFFARLTLNSVHG
ncbi:hypothetical protein CDL12_19342 [Handroanthus impetiginosus]|uniref:Uncharacterized protein n=1 Tax=Handroanthus impetiginosus TaxID=429701 RepID=A0A2G9GS18_9LAMI|nr:hypothetical protein CDL12_19342 [Handroanthus impetiginosus]